MVSTPAGVQSKTGDCKEPDYMETSIFTLNESHDNSHQGSFCVIGKDLECFELDDLY